RGGRGSMTGTRPAEQAPGRRSRHPGGIRVGRIVAEAVLASRRPARRMGAMRIGVLLFEGVDLLDVGGPYEVFLTASRLVARDSGDPPFEVVTVARTCDPVTAYGGLRLVPQVSVADCGPLDVLVVPGTIDVAAATDDGALMATIRELAADTGVTTSVCTRAFLLG